MLESSLVHGRKLAGLNFVSVMLNMTSSTSTMGSTKGNQIQEGLLSQKRQEKSCRS